MPVTFQEATLDNGLTVIAETDPDAHSASVGFFVRTGARDEDPAVMGVSHFLEHMMFKGTERRTADDVNREFDELGAEYNAYTSSELTCFYATVLPEKLSPAIDILSDILRPAIRESDFTAEKGVILEEIAMYKDNPFWVLYEETVERHFDKHPLAHRVLGYEQTIKDLTHDQMRAYFEHRYAADNTTVALAGAIDFDKAVALLDEACAEWNASGARRDLTEPRAADHAFTIRDKNVTRGYLLSLAPAPPIQDDRRYAASVTAQLLGGPDNSRLHWALIETGVADEAEAAYDPHDHAGDFFLYASSTPDRLDEIAARIDAEIKALANEVTEADLEKLRNRLATRITLAGEKPSGRMQRLGRTWTYLEHHIPLDQELERIRAVTAEDVKELLADFPFTPRTTGRLIPE